MVIYSDILLRILVPWFSISGIAIFPFIILKKDIRGTPNESATINHERIHLIQQLELLIVPFLLWYFISFFLLLLKGMSGYKAYRNIIFEKEAYDNMYDPGYLRARRLFSFWNYR